MAMASPKWNSDSQRINKNCQRVLKLVQGSDSCFLIDENRVVYQNGPLNGSLQTTVPKSLPQTVLNKVIFLSPPEILVHEGCTTIYDVISTDITWPQTPTVS